MVETQFQLACWVLFVVAKTTGEVQDTGAEAVFLTRKQILARLQQLLPEPVRPFACDEALLKKACELLSHAGLLKSRTRRGYRLGRMPEQISAFDTLRVFAPHQLEMGGCLCFGIPSCGIEDQCRLLPLLRRLRESDTDILRTATLDHFLGVGVSLPTTKQQTRGSKVERLGRSRKRSS